MKRKDAKQIVKDRLEDYLRGKGIDTSKPFRCLNPEHADHNPSMSYNKEKNIVKCFSKCGKSYDIFDLIGWDYHLTDYKDIFNKAYELYNIKIDGEDESKGSKRDYKVTTTHQKQDESKEEEPAPIDYSAYIGECAKRLEELSNEQRRHINLNIAKEYKLGYDSNFKVNNGQWQALIIPTSKYSYVARNLDKTATGADRVRNRGNKHIFNLDILYTSEKPIFIVEGEIDALSVLSVDGQAIGLGGIGSYRALINELEQSGKKPKAPLIIALDNDDAGEKTARALDEELTRLNILHIKRDVYNGAKDANDAYIDDMISFYDAIHSLDNIKEELREEKIRELEKTSAKSYINDFMDGIAESADTPVISSGFKILDEVLDGGLYEGLYFIGAISSLGKTTLLLQIADQIAQSGQDVLIFSLEMARSELMAKSISRLTLLEAAKKGIDPSNAKTIRGITAGYRYKNYNNTEKALIKSAVEAYSNYANHIYITEGMGNIGVNEVREKIEDHIEVTGKAPIVFIDYAQILAPLDPRLSDKQATDKSVLELKRISRDYKTPVITVSSFNRDNYSTQANMRAFKESGAIEYGSDVLIGLQLQGAGSKDFDVDKAKEKVPRDIELVILKNRNAKTGDKIKYDYFAKFNYFKEKYKIKREY